jgi:glycosyltransferase involved in cell wall biosynthesis
LANRAPLSLLQEDLDRAAEAGPAHASLVDYRADPTRVAHERAALVQADRIVTPHHDLAQRLGERFEARVERLDWISPPTRPSEGGETILFAGPSLARRGVYEMRRAAARLERPLRLTGRATEAAGFWSGLAVETAGADLLADIACVAAPAFVERRPGLLLRALGAGIPVVCTPACGLPPGPLVTLVEPGDAEGLAQALGGVIARAGRSAPP